MTSMSEANEAVESREAEALSEVVKIEDDGGAVYRAANGYDRNVIAGLKTILKPLLVRGAS